jgi:hypothetical protein
LNFPHEKKVVTSLFPTNNARLNLLLLFAQPDNGLFLAPSGIIVLPIVNLRFRVIIKRTHNFASGNDKERRGI